MTKDQLLQRGWHNESIALYLPPPKYKKVKTTGDDKKTKTVEELHYDDSIVYAVEEFLSRTVVFFLKQKGD